MDDLFSDLSNAELRMVRLLLRANDDYRDVTDQALFTAARTSPKSAKRSLVRLLELGIVKSYLCDLYGFSNGRGQGDRDKIAERAREALQELDSERQRLKLQPLLCSPRTRLSALT
jgi:hypothetical protein